MRIRRWGWCAVAASLGIAGLALAAAGRGPQDGWPVPSPRLLQQKDQGAAFEKKGQAEPLPPAPRKPPGHLGTIFRRSDRHDPKLQDRVARVFRAQAVPARWREAFRPILDDPEVNLQGWHAMFAGLGPDPETVKIQIVPAVDRGQSMTVMCALEETYSFRDGRLELVVSKPPESMGYITD